MYIALAAVFGVVAYELYSFFRNLFHYNTKNDNHRILQRYYTIDDLTTNDKSILVNNLTGNNLRRLEKFINWIKWYMPYRYQPYNAPTIYNLSRLSRDDMQILSNNLSFNSFSKLNRFRDNADVLKDYGKFANGQLIAFKGDKIYIYPYMQPINYYKLLLLYFNNMLYSPYENIYPIYIYRDGFLIHLSWYGSSFNIVTDNKIDVNNIRNEIDCEKNNSENGRLRSQEIRDGIGIILSENISQKGVYRVKYYNPFFFR